MLFESLTSLFFLLLFLVARKAHRVPQQHNRIICLSAEGPVLSTRASAWQRPDGALAWLAAFRPPSKNVLDSGVQQNNRFRSLSCAGQLWRSRVYQRTRDVTAGGCGEVESGQMCAPGQVLRGRVPDSPIGAQRGTNSFTCVSLASLVAGRKSFISCFLLLLYRTIVAHIGPRIWTYDNRIMQIKAKCKSLGPPNSSLHPWSD